MFLFIGFDFCRTCSGDGPIARALSTTASTGWIEDGLISRYSHRFPNVNVVCPARVSNSRKVGFRCNVSGATFSYVRITYYPDHSLALDSKESYRWKTPYQAFGSVSDWLEVAIADEYEKKHPKIVVTCPGHVPVQSGAPFVCRATGVPFETITVTRWDARTDDYDFETH